MGNPYNIENFAELPVKVRTWLTKEWGRRDGIRPIGRPPKYPWHEWTDQKVHSALAGRDFHLSVPKFKQVLQQKAYHSGTKVWITTYEEHEKGPTGPVQFWVAFRFYPRDALPPTPTRPYSPYVPERLGPPDGTDTL